MKNYPACNVLKTMRLFSFMIWQNYLLDDFILGLVYLLCIYKISICVLVIVLTIILTIFFENVVCLLSLLHICKCTSSHDYVVNGYFMSTTPDSLYSDLFETAD